MEQGKPLHLFKIYMPMVDTWIIADNSNVPRQIVAKGGEQKETVIYDPNKYNIIKHHVK